MFNQLLRYAKYSTRSRLTEKEGISQRHMASFEKGLQKVAAFIRLQLEVLSYFADRAQAEGVAVNALINELLKKDIDLIEGVK